MTTQQQEDSYLAAETAVYLRLKFNLSYEESDFLSILFEQPEFAAAKISDKTLELIDYLAENFAMTDRTAQNFMKVAEYFGGNSTLKSEYVFGFTFYALIELTRIDRQEVEKFLKAYKEKGVNLPTLSVRQLKTAIKDWKENLTVDVQAEISTAPVIDNNSKPVITKTGTSPIGRKNLQWQIILPQLSQMKKLMQ